MGGRLTHPPLSMVQMGSQLAAKVRPETVAHTIADMT